MKENQTPRPSARTDTRSTRDNVVRIVTQNSRTLKPMNNAKFETEKGNVTVMP